MSLVVASSQIDANGTEDSAAGGALTMTAGGGTLSLGIETTSGDTAATEGEAYLLLLNYIGWCICGVGYSGYDANNNTSSKTDVTISQSIGGGANLRRIQKPNWCWCCCSRKLN